MGFYNILLFRTGLKPQSVTYFTIYLGQRILYESIMKPTPTKAAMVDF